MIATLTAVGLAQLPFMLLPGPFWDGWIYHLLFMRGDRAAFLAPFVSNGRPLGGWVLWWAMDWLGLVTGPKWLSMVAMTGSSACLYGALRVRNSFSRHDALLISVITTTVPATQTALSSSALQFFLGFSVFYLGLYIITRAAAAEGVARFPLYLLSMVCAGLSVMLAEAPLALLPLYALGWMFGFHGPAARQLPVRQLARIAVLHSAAFWVGVACLIATFQMFPTTGGYEGAHQLQLRPLEMLKTCALFTIALIGCEMPLILTAAWIIKRQGLQIVTGKRVQIAVSLVVLGMALAPYIASGRWPAMLGWGTRTLLFSGLGIGLLIQALLQPFTSRLEARRLGLMMFVVCAAALACTLWRVPLWAARQVRDDGMRVSLATLPQARIPSVVWVDDPNWVIASPYRDYEWTAQFQLATGRRDVLALARSYNEAADLQLSARHMRDEHGLLGPGYDPVCQADLKVARLPAAWPLYATIALAIRTVSSADRYQNWLQGKVPVQLNLRVGCLLPPDKP